jgi:hypothetical protein
MIHALDFNGFNVQANKLSLASDMEIGGEKRVTFTKLFVNDVSHRHTLWTPKLGTVSPCYGFMCEPSARKCGAEDAIR